MNRLAQSQSPYLLQHQDNPVDWYPWGEEAFERARAEDKPVFLSIGYATCHWCHVMAHESFEDAEVAALLNAHFVAVKVDREERPDVDAVYMGVCQAVTGHGGWPLTILMTPEKEPFFAGTYLPRTSRGGRLGLVELLERAAEAWAAQREALGRSAAGLTAQVRAALAGAETAGDDVFDDALVRRAASDLAAQFDAERGGFGPAPKFPRPHTLVFLLRHAHRTGQQAPRRMALATLDAMRWGGIYDHLGGGFHRYATDAAWRLPHFEKMLYDQALLVYAYAEAYAATGQARYADTARAVVAYVQRDLQDPGGAFYAAEDADSEGREGAFYVWTLDEVEAVLGPDAALFAAAYGLQAEGNFEEEATGRRTGENVLYPGRDLDAPADITSALDAEARARLATARRHLFETRARRERPALDDKVLTDWNGLMVAALAHAARLLGEPAYAEAAARAARFVLDHLRTPEGRLLHRWRRGVAGLPPTADDYAFLAWGCLELYAATFEPAWLAHSLALAERLLADFRDEAAGGLYLSAHDAEPLPFRPKEAYDGATPSANAVAVNVLLRLARLTGRADLEEQARAIGAAFGRAVRAHPVGFTALLQGAEFALGRAQEVVVAGAPEAEATRRLLEAATAGYAPHRVVLVRPPGAAGEALARLAPFTAAMDPVDGGAAAYVCENFACRAPVTTPEALAAALRATPADATAPGFNDS